MKLSFVYPGIIILILSISSIFANSYSNPYITLTVSTIVGICFIFALWGKIIKHDLPPLILATLAIVSISLCLSTLFSIDHQASIEEVLKALSGILLFLITYNWIKNDTEQNQKILIYILITIALIIILWGLIQLIYIQPNIDKRYTSFFHQRDVAAGFIILFLPLILTFALLQQKLIYKIAYTTLGGIFLLSLLLTGSRGGWIAVVIVIFGWLILNRRDIANNLPQTIIMLLSPIILILLVSTTKFVSTVSSIPSVITAQDSSMAYRIELYKQAIQIVQYFPLFGSGPATFGQISPMYGTNVRYYAEFAHSMYIQTLAETGIIGFIAIIILFGSILYYGILAVKTNKKNIYMRNIAIALLLGLVGLMLHMATDIDWQFNAIQLFFWVMVALLLSYLPNVPTKSKISQYAAWPIGIIYLSLSLVLLANIILLYQGNEMFKTEKDQIAVRFLTEAILIDPLDSRTRQALSMAYFRLNEKEKALAESLKLTQLTPYNAISYSHLAKMAKKLNEYDISEKAYIKAIELAPYQNPINYIGLAKLYEQTGKKDKIIEPYKLAEKRFTLDDILTKDFYNPEYKNHILYIYQQLYIYYSDSNDKSQKYRIQQRISRLIAGKQDEFSTPETTIKNFWYWMTNRDLKKVNNSFIADLQNTNLAFVQLPLEVKSAKPKNIEIKMENDFIAIVKYHIEYTSQKDEKVLSPILTDTLILQSEGWKIKELGILSQ